MKEPGSSSNNNMPSPLNLTTRLHAHFYKVSIIVVGSKISQMTRCWLLGSQPHRHVTLACLRILFLIPAPCHQERVCVYLWYTCPRGCISSFPLAADGNEMFFKSVAFTSKEENKRRKNLLENRN